MSMDRCRKLVASVSLLSQTEAEELFKMIHKNSCEYTRNNNGVFINLAWITSELLEELENYVKFCTLSRCELKKYESLCDVLNHNLHAKKPEPERVLKSFHLSATAKQPAAQSAGDGDEGDDVKGYVTRISSSVRFALLKKRFAKLNVDSRKYQNDLKAEPYSYP